jgi:hypothetical protein
MFSEIRPRQVARPRRWNPTVLPSTLMLMALAAYCGDAPFATSAPPDEAQKTSSRANTADDPDDDNEPDGSNDKSNGKLSYNDGTPEGKHSYSNSGEMIQFELSGDETKVTAVRIHGSRYGTPKPPQENLAISFLNDDMSEVIATKLAPYSLFKRGAESWVLVKFSKPVAVPKKFWVVLDFHAGKTKGVYVSYDKSSGGVHSRVGLSGADVAETGFDADWMIEAVLAK